MQFVHVWGTAQLLNPRNQIAHSLISFSPTNFFLTQHPPRSQLHEGRKHVIKRNVMQSNAATVGFLSLIAQAACTDVRYHCVSFKIQKYPEVPLGIFCGTWGALAHNLGTRGLRNLSDTIQEATRGQQSSLQKRGATCTFIHSFITPLSMGNLPGTSPFSVVAIYVTLIRNNAGWGGGLQFYTCYWRGYTPGP